MLSRQQRWREQNRERFNAYYRDYNARKKTEAPEEYKQKRREYREKAKLEKQLQINKMAAEIDALRAQLIEYGQALHTAPSAINASSVSCFSSDNVI